MKTALKIVITGGPGTGKSSLLDLLRQKGYRCENEVAREVIRDQLLINGNLVPWADLLGYSKLVFNRIAQVTKEADQFSVTIFDRSAVDVIAYLRHGEIPVPEYMMEAVQKLGYHKTVFFAPFWPQIYLNDAERKENAQLAEEISDALNETYRLLGFEVCQLEKVSAQTRANFIEQYVENLANNE